MSHQCPDEMTLAALFDGLLDPAEKATLHGEMSRCPDCQTALAMIGLGLADEPADLAAVAVPPALEARVRALYAPATEPIAEAARALVGVVVRWVGERLSSLAEGLAPAPLPALAVRGQGTAGDGGGLRFEIEVAGTPVELLLAESARMRTRVTITPLAPPAPQTRVELTCGARVEESLALEADGVHLYPLAPGRYELVFKVPGHPLTMLPLDVRR